MTKAEIVQILEEDVLNEENTDKLIDFIVKKIKLPWYVPGRIVKKVLDKMLPDVLLDALKSML